MSRVINLKTIPEKLWFVLLVVYIVAGYFAYDLLMPSIINSVVLYIFLGYSLVAILCSGKLKLTPIFCWELACLAVSFVAMIYSPSFSIFSGAYYALIVNFVLVFILTQMPWNEQRFEMIMKVFMLSAAGLIIVLALTGNLEDTSDSGRLGQELTGNANKLATMLMVGAMYAFWLLVSSSDKITKILSFISVLIIYFGMFLSGGRKFVVIPLIFLYILLLYKTDRNGKRHLIFNTLLIVVIFVLLYQLIMRVPFLYDSIGYRFDGFFALFDESKDVDGSTEVRMKMIEAAWEKWPEKPLFGHGFDSFKYYNASSVTGHEYYSHNNFVELLYNQGIVGFITYYSFYAYLLCSALKEKGTLLYKGFVVGVILVWLVIEYAYVTYSVTPMQFMLFFAFYCLQTQTYRRNVE